MIDVTALCVQEFIVYIYSITNFKSFFFDRVMKIQSNQQGCTFSLSSKLANTLTSGNQLKYVAGDVATSTLKYTSSLQRSDQYTAVHIQPAT